MPLYNQPASGGGGISPPAGDIGGSTGTPTVVATHLSAALPLLQGGTGQTSAQTAMDALAGATTSTQYLRGNGTHVVMAAIAAGDLPGATSSTQGAVILDNTAGDIKALGAQSAGTNTTTAPRADHVHPTTGLVTGVTATDTSIVVAGSSAAPTVATGTLDVIAAQHAPAADWSNNSHKITGLSNGSASSDAAAFGQIPTAFQSTGAGAKALGLGLLTIPPASCNTTNGVVAKVMYWQLVTAAVSQSVTTLGVWLTGAGVTAGGTGINGMALYTESGTLLQATGDMTTAMQSTGFAEGTITSASLTAGTSYYLAVTANFTGTVPQVAATNFSSAPPPVLNGHYLSLHATNQASFPSPSFTPSSQTLDAHMFVMYAR